MAQRQTVLLELAYNGASFRGVQVQPGHRTVASDLRDLLTRVCEAEPHALTFAARTDSGVHAAQNFATCWFRGNDLSERHLLQLQAHSDEALRIVRAAFVNRSINARSSAGDKHYQYRLETRVPRELLQRGTWLTDRWQVHPALQLDAMQHAARLLSGTHDYSAFRASGCDGKSPIKTVYSFDLEQHGDAYTFDVRGGAFLRHMVRILVGTVVEVGAGLRTVDSVKRALDSKDRTLAGMTAPARGLYLMHVAFDGNNSTETK